MFWGFVTTATLRVIPPLFRKTISFGIWTMERHEVLYCFVMIVQPPVVRVTTIFLWSLDCLYLGFWTEIVIQFRILSQYLEDLSADGNSIREMEINLLDKMKIGI